MEAKGSSDPYPLSLGVDYCILWKDNIYIRLVDWVYRVVYEDKERRVEMDQRA